MYERLKDIRSAKKLNQTEFAKALGIGQSTLAMMEVGKREISERHIKTICAIFGVCEKWLRDGIGEMFVETDKTVISALVDEYELDPLDQKIVECYLNLGALQRKVIKGYLRSLVDAMLADDTYDEYREQYIEENAGAVAARGGQAEQIDELKDLYDQRDGE